MDSPERLFHGQGGDHAFDLPPVAEARDIADVAALLGADRRFQLRIVAELGDEVRSIGERRAAVDVQELHAGHDKARALSGLRTITVNGSFTMFAPARLALPPPLWQSAAMASRTTRAGGCFLTLLILLGFVGGLAIDNPMKGILIGTAAGIAVAVVLWLIDRRN